MDYKINKQTNKEDREIGIKAKGEVKEKSRKIADVEMLETKIKGICDTILLQMPPCTENFKKIKGTFPLVKNGNKHHCLLNL